MAQILKLKRSSVAGRVPTTATLAVGEIAINTADGLVYIRKDDSTIIPLIGVNTAAVTGSVVILGSITATSFTGSFAGNITGSFNGTLSKSASNGAGIVNFTFDGSNNVTVALDTGSAHFTQGVISLIGTASPHITASDTTGAGGIDLSYNPATRILSGSLVNSSITIGGTSIALGASANTFNSITVSNLIATGSLSGSFTGSFRGNLTGTSSWASNASAAISSSYAATASIATSASFATSASYATLADGLTFFDTGSLLRTGSISNATITLTKADGTSFPLTVNNVANAISATSASYAATASYTLVAQTVLNLDTGSFVTTGSVSNATLTFTQADQTTFNLTVNNVQNATSASYATVAQTALNVNTGSLLITASIFDATITLQKGNLSTFDLVVNNVQNAVSASYATIATTVLDLPTGSFVTTGSVNNATLTFTQADNSTFNLTVNNVQNAFNAATASSADSFTVRNDATVAGDLTVGGKVTAKEFHTEFVSASIVYSSGSTKFGDTLDDLHQFTGSVQITGSLTAPDITINQWGSVSASLAGLAVSASAGTLQTVTNNGNVTTNSISISSSLYVSQSIYSKGEEVLDFAVAMAIALG